MSKKKSPKKVRIVSKLEFPGGIVVSSSGKGIMKGKNVRVTEQPVCLVSKDAKTTTYVAIGKKELAAKSAKNGGLEVI